MCDIKDDNLGIDCEKAEKLVTKKTKAIIPLHFAGIPCDIDKVYKLAKKHNLRIVEDCCHAFGSTIEGKKIGSFGDIACFSFDPVKVITSIDGGRGGCEFRKGNGVSEAFCACLAWTKTRPCGIRTSAHGITMWFAMAFATT